MTTTTDGAPAAAAASDGPLLEVRGLAKRFAIPHSEQHVQACSDITLTLRRGETLGLIGESGSGKTTLGRCILRLIEPSEGEIVFEGRDITRLGAAELRRLRSDMQIVFQEPFDSLNPQMTIAKQITEPLRIHEGVRGKAERRAHAVELLDMVGLPPSVADALPTMLSPGALQRCSIARAIATRPKLIVLDEPTSVLPPEAERDVIAVLKELQVRLGLTYVLISHDLSIVRLICDRVAVMYLSQVVELGTREDVFERARHPYARALLASALTPDPASRHDRSNRAERLEGEIPSPIDLPRGCYLASRCPYVVDRCRTEPQLLEEVTPGHRARCWRVVDGELTDDVIAAVRARRTADAVSAA